MPTPDRWIRTAATAAVAVLALIAFGISFSHIYDLAIRFGENEIAAQTYAVTIDGLLIVGGLVGLYCSRYRIDKPALARTALALGVGATMIANVAHGLANGIAGAIFAGWPAIALLVSAELLLWLVAAAQDTNDRQVVILENQPEASVLSQALTLLSNNRSMPATEVGKRLGLNYQDALRITKQAKEVLDRN